MTAPAFFEIAGHPIGPEHPPFIIGEAGLNHCGDLERALRMIGFAKSSGCTAVKFQTYRAVEFCQPDDPMFPVFQRCELPASAWRVLKAECDRIGIIFLSTPQNRSDLQLLLDVGIPAIKVGSDDFCNLPLLADYAREQLPLILSCGMADRQDIDRASIATSATDVALLVCTSQYPCPPPEARLARIHLLAAQLPHPVGLSDHTRGTSAACAAVALGACVFEKHFDLDGAGPEAFAELPSGLTAWAAAIREAHAMLGDGSFDLTELELAARAKYQRRPGQQLRGHA